MSTILGTRYPLIQGALARISQPALVAAVANAGGLGVLTTVDLTPATLAAAIAAVRGQTTAPFGVNLMLQQDNIAALVPYLLAHPVPVVTTSAGTPKAFARALQAVGTRVVAVVPSVRVAQKMAALGVDLLVAEGMESGGHIGATTTFALVQEIAQAVAVPVYAAGGIADATGVAAARALGASGVQVGTAWLTATETPIAPAYKQAVVAASDTDTVITGQALGAPVRCLKSPQTLAYLKREAAGAPASELAAMMAGSLQRAIAGDLVTGAMMAGQIAGKLTTVQPAAQIVAQLFPA